MPNPSILIEDTDYHGNEDCHHEFDFAALDTIEDQIREAIASNQSVTHLVNALVEMESNERVNEAIAAVVGYIADAERPRLAADHIAWVSGMRIRQGESLPAISKRHGVSKQAFCQAALKLAAILHIKPARAMRSELSKAVMAKMHFKRTKHE